MEAKALATLMFAITGGSACGISGEHDLFIQTTGCTPNSGPAPWWDQPGLLSYTSATY